MLAYLHANGFKAYIVSGGDIEVIRVWTERAHGIPPEKVIGTSIKVKFELRNGKRALIRLPEIDFIDDKAGKPVGSQVHRPSPDPRLWQLGRGSPDAPVDHSRHLPPPRWYRPSHRRPARVGLRPAIADRLPGQGSGRSLGQGLNRRGDEAPLDAGFPL